MKKGLSEIICIIDRSGSMSTIEDDVIGGFNTFLEEQKKLPGEATMTYAQFDDKYEVVFENKPLQEVKPLDTSTFVPRGMTALLDAIGKTINTVGERLAKTPEEQKPEAVIIVILTDGHENASVEFINKVKIKEMIIHQESKYNWEFIFLAANQDALKEGSSMGVKLCNSFTFEPTGEGVRTAYSEGNKMSARYRA